MVLKFLAMVINKKNIHEMWLHLSFKFIYSYVPLDLQALYCSLISD